MKASSGRTGGFSVTGSVLALLQVESILCMFIIMIYKLQVD